MTPRDREASRLPLAEAVYNATSSRGRARSPLPV